MFFVQKTLNKLNRKMFYVSFLVFLLLHFYRVHVAFWVSKIICFRCLKTFFVISIICSSASAYLKHALLSPLWLQEP